MSIVGETSRFHQQFSIGVIQIIPPQSTANARRLETFQYRAPYLGLESRPKEHT